AFRMMQFSSSCSLAVHFQTQLLLFELPPTPLPQDSSCWPRRCSCLSSAARSLAPGRIAGTLTLPPPRRILVKLQLMLHVCRSRGWARQRTRLRLHRSRQLIRVATRGRHILKPWTCCKSMKTSAPCAATATAMSPLPAPAAKPTRVMSGAGLRRPTEVRSVIVPALPAATKAGYRLGRKASFFAGSAAPPAPPALAAPSFPAHLSKQRRTI
ncbi:hypothetical protein V8C86DRAFT_2464739, partial [Haematococcus lacustris]